MHLAVISSAQILLNSKEPDLGSQVLSQMEGHILTRICPSFTILSEASRLECFLTLNARMRGCSKCTCYAYVSGPMKISHKYYYIYN